MVGHPTTTVCSAVMASFYYDAAKCVFRALRRRTVARAFDAAAAWARLALGQAKSSCSPMANIRKSIWPTAKHLNLKSFRGAVAQWLELGTHNP